MQTIPELEQYLSVPEHAVIYTASGMLAICCLVFVYFYIRTREKLYLSIALMAWLALFHAFMENMIALWGGTYFDADTSRTIQLFQQVSVAFFLFAFPFFMGRFLTLNEALHALNRKVYLAGLAIAVTILVLGLSFPEWFVSQTTPLEQVPRTAYNYGRGAGGPLYLLRDAILGILIVYSVALFVLEYKNSPRRRELVLPMLALALLMLTAVDDVLSIWLRRFPDMFPHAYFSRFVFGMLLFIAACSGIALRRFFDVWARSRTNEEELTKTNEVAGNALARIGDGASHTQTAAESLAGVFEDLIRSAKEMDARAADLAQGADAIHESVTSLSGASRSSGASIRSVSQSTDTLEQSIGSIHTFARDARSVVSDTAVAVQELTREMERLGSQAREIGGIVEFITDFAEQTKLLALNATIQAARAGKAGKGFGVVAGEVKELAAQVNRAAADILARIQAIRSSIELTTTSIASVNDAIRNVDERMSSIAGSVETQSESTRAIAASVNEVTKMVLTVDTSLRTLQSTTAAVKDDSSSAREASQRVAALSARVRESAQELTSISELLARTVNASTA